MHQRGLKNKKNWVREERIRVIGDGLVITRDG